MSQTLENSPKEVQVFETNYEFCCGCERRMHKDLLDGGVSCRNCRGLESDGSPRKVFKSPSKEEQELVNS